MGHKCCSKGRESCGCKDHLHRAHGSSRGCLLASAPWVPLWVGCWWSEAHDVSWIHLFLNILSKLYNIWLSISSFFFPLFFFYFTEAGILVQTILLNQATQLMLTLLKWTAFLSILIVSSFLPQDQLTRLVWFTFTKRHRVDFSGFFWMHGNLLVVDFLFLIKKFFYW